MTLKAIAHKAEEGGYWAEVPSLPGCLTQGETLDELKANLHEAIELWLSVSDERMASHPNDRHNVRCTRWDIGLSIRIISPSENRGSHRI